MYLLANAAEFQHGSLNQGLSDDLLEAIVFGLVTSPHLAALIPGLQVGHVLAVPGAVTKLLQKEIAKTVRIIILALTFFRSKLGNDPGASSQSKENIFEFNAEKSALAVAVIVTRIIRG